MKPERREISNGSGQAIANAAFLAWANNTKDRTIMASLMAAINRVVGGDVATAETEAGHSPAKKNTSTSAEHPLPDLGAALVPADQWRFLDGSPWTRTMLELAADKWQVPLDGNDLGDIIAGAYLFEEREAYLCEYLADWADENPERVAELQAEIKSSNNQDHGRQSRYVVNLAQKTTERLTLGN
jgi:hypothetical protein